MKTQLLILFLFIGYSNLCAQEAKFATIKTGSRIKDVLKFTEIFLYPEYTKGKVFFRDGSAATSMMNYNSLTDEMLFIDPAQDTLALTGENTIKFLSIGLDTFYYDEGYFRQVANNGVEKLAVKEIWELGDTRKIGAFNSPSSTNEVTSFKLLMHAFGKRDDLILNEDLVLKKKANYYLRDKDNRFKRAGRKDLQIFVDKAKMRDR